MSLFGIVVKPRHLHYILSDGIALLLAIELAQLLARLWGEPTRHVTSVLLQYSGASLFLVCSTVLALYVFDGFERSTNYRRRRTHLRLWAAVWGAQAAALLAYGLFPHGWWGPRVAVATGLSLSALLSLTRYLLCWVSPNTAFPTRVIVIGRGRAAWLTEDLIRGDPDHASVYKLVGFITPEAAHPHRRRDDIEDALPTGVEPPGPDLGTASDLRRVVVDGRVDLIVVAVSGNLPGDLTRALLECKTLGATIKEMPTFYKLLTSKIPVHHLTDCWLIFGPVFFRKNLVAATARRAADVCFAMTLGLVTLPVVALAALAVRLESPGSPIFFQERLGKNEKPFKLVKLRTMCVEAEDTTGPVWSTGRGDKRVTRVGRFLRSTRIDELPQLYNVLHGDMSLVGPRPERDHFVQHLKGLSHYYSLRFAVKPGLTGWAQVNFRYGNTDEDAIEKLRFELYEILEMNPALYLFILLKTVQTVLTRTGS